MIEDSHFRHESRFYPIYPMKINIDEWRLLSSSERMMRGFRYNDEIEQLLFKRVENVHSSWNNQQHKMMFFRLRYAGEHFETLAKAKIERGDLSTKEVEAVRAIRLPFTRAESAVYTSISHPDLDETANIWPSPAERGTHF